MKTRVTPEYYKKLLNAIKAVQYLLDFHFEHSLGGTEDYLDELSNQLSHLTDEMQRSTPETDE